MCVSWCVCALRFGVAGALRECVCLCVCVCVCHFVGLEGFGVFWGVTRVHVLRHAFLEREKARKGERERERGRERERESHNILDYIIFYVILL